jgi:hypothetical protein
MDMLNKGNVLQYKKNSQSLSKSQIYSRIAQRPRKTWATQTDTYSNANLSSLKRTGNAQNIAIDPITGAILGETNEAVTCTEYVPSTNDSLPVNTGGGSSVAEPGIPPAISDTSGSTDEVFPTIQEETEISPIIIQNGGSLICSVQENICTGEITAKIFDPMVHPTTDSDVPGSIQLLYWNARLNSWYPRERRRMTNSGNKWPVNATLLAAKYDK